MVKYIILKILYGNSIIANEYIKFKSFIYNDLQNNRTYFTGDKFYIVVWEKISQDICI